jgi:hypothetical protein
MTFYRTALVCFVFSSIASHISYGTRILRSCTGTTLLSDHWKYYQNGLLQLAYVNCKFNYTYNENEKLVLLNWYHFRESGTFFCSRVPTFTAGTRIPGSRSQIYMAPFNIARKNHLSSEINVIFNYYLTLYVYFFKITDFFLGLRTFFWERRGRVTADFEGLVQCLRQLHERKQ